MWKNCNNITYKSLLQAKRITDAISFKTPLLKLENLSSKINKPVLIKDESVQRTSSFKIRGVYYCIYSKLNQLISESNFKSNTNIITQSTGNHGISTLFSIYNLIQQNPWNNKKLISSLNPIIYSSKFIQPVKYNYMKYYLEKIREITNDNFRGNIYTQYDSYLDALNNRLDFEQNNPNSLYIEHGFPEIITGHGVIGLEIADQLIKSGVNIDSNITFLASCGAGGPLGVSIGLKYIFKNSQFVIVQTDDQNALVQSLIENRLVYNNSINKELPFNYADGIAVDCPENFAFNYSKYFTDYAVTVKHDECFDNAKNVYKDITNSYNLKDLYIKPAKFVGGTTVSVYNAISNYESEDFIKNSDLIVMLGCEGNIDDSYIQYFKH